MSGQKVKVTSGELTQQNATIAESGTSATVAQKISTILSRLKQSGRSVVQNPAFAVSLSVTGLLVVGQQLGLLEPLELRAFDHLMQLRPALPPDPRLLIVKVTEADIQSYGFPLKDATIDQLLTKVEKHQPAVIGLDIYRDMPQPPNHPGHAELMTKLQKSDRIVPVCNISNEDNPGVPPPPGVPIERVGFSDLAIDPNGVIRRALLFLTPSANSRCTSEFSFSFQLAKRYLEQKGIKPDLTPQDYLTFGKVVFKPLEANDGGYRQADNGGYQILLNYRAGDTLARSVTLTDILQNRVDSTWIKDRIILIGVTAPSIDDAFYTPYSFAQPRIEKMPGVVVHGQIVSQLVSTVLDQQPLFWFWSDWGEILWIWGWALTGGVVVRLIRRPRQLVLSASGTLGLLLGLSACLFFEAGWIPVVAPALGLIATGTGVLAYNAYEAEQERLKAEKERRYIEEKAREQENNLALLQALLKEKFLTPPASELEASSLTEQTDTAIADSELYNSTTLWPQDESPSECAYSPPQKRDPNLLAGHYHINRVLGSGGFGLTYLAEDTHRPGSPQCVVKHLKPARQDDKFLHVARRLFETEAEILEKLGKHSQIPQLLAYFEQDREFYLVQEYIPGHPLSDELPVDKKLPEKQVMEMIEGVLKILQFIHEHRVIHRDIKPSNIMRRQVDNQFVLIDFGAVKQIQPQEQAEQENPTVAIGTRGYAAPEQYAGHPTFCSDIYALGMIGIQALTGIPPHQLPFESCEVIWRNLANVDDPFARILNKMVRYHFAERYQSAIEVLEDLQRVIR
ncbi:MAG TPA: CHASE2 domain-containing serine/threonine-protein kinase [Coleofasciculaceae cyanobacterium]